MHVLDTDTLSRAHAGNPHIAEHIRQVGPDNVVTTVVNAFEVLRGRHDFLLKAEDAAHLLRAQELLALSQSLLRALVVLPVDGAVAAVFERLRRDRSLRKIGRADLLIACIALAHGAVLVTRNLRHFRLVPGLHLENWTDRR